VHLIGEGMNFKISPTEKTRENYRRKNSNDD